MRWWCALVLLVAWLASPAAAEEGVPLVDASGNEVVVRPAAGETLVLHFWATWCPSCLDDLAHLADAAAGCRGVRVLAVNAGDDADDVAQFVREHAVRLPVLRDPSGRAWRKLAGRGLPMNVYWSAAERTSDEGAKSAEQWAKRLAELGCGDGALRASAGQLVADARFSYCAAMP
jgi:thiol-disulfide isomerase/thioredoxin